MKLSSRHIGLCGGVELKICSGYKLVVGLTLQPTLPQGMLGVAYRRSHFGSGNKEKNFSASDRTRATYIKRDTTGYNEKLIN